MKRILTFFVLVFCVASLRADEPGIVSGTVVNEKGEPIFDANVRVKNVFDQENTDKNGYFEMKLFMTTFELTVSASGYESHVQTCTREKGQNLSLDTIVLKKVPLKYTFGRYDTARGKFDQIIFNIGYQQGWRAMGHAGIGLADTRLKFRGIVPMWSIRQIQIGTEFNYKFSQPVIGPYLAYDATSGFRGYGTLLGYGVSAIYFTNLQNGALYINPRVGIRWFAFWNLMFGYNIPVSGSEMKPYVNRFTVNFTLMLFNRQNDKSLQ